MDSEVGHEASPDTTDQVHAVHYCGTGRQCLTKRNPPCTGFRETSVIRHQRYSFQLSHVARKILRAGRQLSFFSHLQKPRLFMPGASRVTRSF